MMRKLLMGAVALTAMTATPALADDPSGTFTVSGSVAAQCGGIGNGTIAFNALSTGTDGKINDSRSASSTGQDVFCNSGGATITIVKNDMTNATVPSDTTNFTNTITYDADVKIGATSYASGATVGIKAGSLVVTASNLSSNAKIPVAGSYSGTVVVTLSPGA